MNRDQATALAKAIKESYRRLEYGANDVRIKSETDTLIDQLVAPFIITNMVQRDQPHPEIAAVYTDPPCPFYPRCGCPNTGECVR